MNQGLEIGGERLAPGVRDLSALLVLLVAYAAAAYAGLSWATVQGAGSPVWPASGVAIAGLLIGGARLWPAILFGRLLAGQLAGSELAFWTEAGIAAGNGLAAVIPALLFRKFRVDPGLADLPSALRYIAIAGGGGALVAASIGGFFLVLAAGLHPSAAVTLWVLWAVGTFAGVVVVGPAILSWWSARARPPPRLYFILGLVAIFSGFMFLYPYQPWLRTWHLLPLLIWAALTHQVRGASAAMLILAGFATLGASLGYYSFSDASTSFADGTPLLQQFLSITACAMLLLGAVDAERQRRGEERLKMALDGADQGSFSVDVATGAMTCDARARALLRLPADAAPVELGALASAVHRNDRLRVRRAALRCLDARGDGECALDARLHLGEEGYRWFSIRGRATFDGLGRYRKAVAVHGTIRDISDRVHAEEKAIESEAFIRHVLDSLFAFVGVLTPDGTLIEANRAPLEMAGLKAGDVEGRKFWDCYWWSYDPQVQDQLREAVARCRDGETLRYDVRVRKSEDELVWIDFQLAPLRDQHGRITHLIPSAMDLTERKAAERERERLTSIINATPDFVGLTDVAGRLIYLSPGGRALAGLDPDEEVRGRSIADFHPPEVAERILRVAIPAAIEHGVWSGEVRLLRRDGHAIHVSQMLLAHRNENGAVEHISMINRDITARVRTAERQSALLRELSHRVKNTLAIVQSIARRTARKHRDPADFVRSFEGRLESLSASHALLTDSNWDGVMLKDAVRSQLAPLMTENGDQVSIEGPDILLPAENATNFGLVLHELATNALRYGAMARPDGRLEVSWRRTEIGFALSWREFGMTPCAPSSPSSRGFGAMMVDSVVERIERRYEPTGLKIDMEIRLYQPAQRRCGSP